ncbi:MAG: gliding motility protein GldC [Ignavibacteria bacterium]|nr:gliding motility protein GldC [Ignavibacteria bacterium]
MNRKSEIKFTIELDDKKMPEKIEWQADDADFEGTKEAKTMMLSLWDKEDKVTLGIDLWTKDMLVNDMNLHFYQMILKLGVTYRKAASDTETAKMFDDFASEFAGKLKLFDKK